MQATDDKKLALPATFDARAFRHTNASSRLSKLSEVGQTEAMTSFVISLSVFPTEASSQTNQYTEVDATERSTTRVPVSSVT